MRYDITEHDPDVEIHIAQTGERTPQVLASLQDCQQRRCGCPTDQYDRLEDTLYTSFGAVTSRSAGCLSVCAVRCNLDFGERPGASS